MIEVSGKVSEALITYLTDSEREIDFDGLHISSTDKGYQVDTPSTDASEFTHTALLDYITTAEVAPYVTNWYYWESTLSELGRHRRAFLRHAEGAHTHDVPTRYTALRSDDGCLTEWGEIQLTTTLDTRGRRHYDIRHQADEEATPERIETYTDPLDAREISTYDDRGRYRPLQTAPSLQTGWIFPDLNGRDAVETINFLYPASIANWNLERNDELDVTHWRETVDRQTGIYDIVEELPRSAVEWVAEACCVDSQCLKRREWQYTEDDQLEADGGTGTFPCREPCSLVIAASRRWTKLEEEDERTYEFDLTPSEKEQIEDIINAVADGRVDEIREADVYKGANQYRTRFLRAKRVDDEGRLSGTPTENSQHTAVDDTDDDAESENEDESHDHDGDRHDNQMSEKQTEDNEELTGDE
ncbi:DR2241 family protein [Haloquadratum walsbyi]|jgi:hypothetical protein|uniref:Uncharacterized protein n=1 Tax=Haloquadratum walsbyi J07HQW2 TaxID=1238425 RepID=U1NHL7_9EURY|nr:DR2241 family protein [Haloquadratum walsbyi]ERG96680.1 MAG: hypothetical protein J07HQW2_03163 [Haloquadratum walsbyi J07HQW2]